MRSFALKTIAVARFAAFALLAAIAFAFALPQAASAQTEGLTGTWNFIPEKSSGPGAYKSMTLTFDNAGNMTVDGVDAKGKPMKGAYTAVIDGKSHPVAGISDYDNGSWKKISDTSTSYQYLKRKDIVVLGTRNLTNGGQTLTFSETLFDNKGKPVGNSVQFFARPGFDLASLDRPAAAPGQTTYAQPGLSADETAASAALEKGDADTAIALFTKAIATNPKATIYFDYVSRGIAYAKKDMNDQAIADFDAALKIKPGDADALFRRGGIHVQQKNYQAAIEDFTETVKTDPMNAMAYRLRGFAYNTLGNDKAAGADYDQACKLNKDLCQN